MSGPMSRRIKGLLSSSQGRDLMQGGRRHAAKPDTRHKLQQLMAGVAGWSSRRR
ncbi:hypothetical protein [Micromonospora sp. RTP1Z1]|uniref:hypothetical protein n=1 Tax=Micromonospora sp. RTP1Z1 TaxID=2994043 RepID=UPI0029C61F79|nr:hypothetical protein [Micromonospora sp. RTP1Z1]